MLTDFQEVVSRSRVWAEFRKAKIATKGEFVGLLEQFHGICWICHLNKAISFDHVIPKSVGGPNSIDNLRPICRFCNSRKGGKYPFDVEQIRQGTYIKNEFMMQQGLRTEYWWSEEQMKTICNLRRRQFEAFGLFDCFRLNIDKLEYDFMYQF